MNDLSNTPINTNTPDQIPWEVEDAAAPKPPKTPVLSPAELQKQLDELDLPPNVKDELDKLVKGIHESKSVRANGSILNRIMRLITELLPAMQAMGAAQAEQLIFTTGMQKLYTKLIADIPIYTEQGGNGTLPIKDPKERDELNRVNSLKAEKYRALRDTWADTAKKQQSTVNTTNEAVNQQTDLLTTFLQQLRELVSIITR